MERSIAGPLFFLLLFLTPLFLLPAAAAATLGEDPFPGVMVVEESSQALCAWHRAGLRSMPLVHVGARPVFHSPDVDLGADGKQLHKALKGHSCEELAERTAGYIRKDSLYTEEDFALAAHRLGVISELWWVVPSPQTLPEAELEPFREWMGETFGLPGEFISGLRYDGSILKGEWGGLPLRICALKDLPLLEGPVIVSIDTGLLVKLYDNPVKEGMLDLLGSFFATLRERKLEGAAVSVSTGRRDTPLSFRYLGGRVGDYLRDPTAFAEGPPESWRRQQQFEYLDFMLARDGALAEAERFAALDDASPLPYYGRATVAARRGAVEAAEKNLQEAIVRDPAYRRGYVALAEVLYGAKLKEEAFALLRRGRKNHPDDLEIGIVLVKMLRGRGMPGDAAEAASSLAKKNPAVPLLHLVSADALRAAGRTDEAAAAMERFRETAPPGRWREEVLQGWSEALSLPDGGLKPFPLP